MTLRSQSESLTRPYNVYNVLSLDSRLSSWSDQCVSQFQVEQKKVALSLSRSLFAHHFHYCVTRDETPPKATLASVCHVRHILAQR